MSAQPEVLLGPVRLGILIALVAVFFLLDGFSFPVDALSRQRRAWLLGIALYCSGAFCLTCLDVTVGLMDRTSQRLLCMVAGGVIMGAGLAVQAMVRAAG